MIRRIVLRVLQFVASLSWGKIVEGAITAGIIGVSAIIWAELRLISPLNVIAREFTGPYILCRPEDAQSRQIEDYGDARVRPAASAYEVDGKWFPALRFGNCPSKSDDFKQPAAPTWSITIPKTGIYAIRAAFQPADVERRASGERLSFHPTNHTRRNMLVYAIGISVRGRTTSYSQTLAQQSYTPTFSATDKEKLPENQKVADWSSPAVVGGVELPLSEGDVVVFYGAIRNDSKPRALETVNSNFLSLTYLRAK